MERCELKLLPNAQLLSFIQTEEEKHIITEMKLDQSA